MYLLRQQCPVRNMYLPKKCQDFMSLKHSQLEACNLPSHGYTVHGFHWTAAKAAFKFSQEIENKLHSALAVLIMNELICHSNVSFPANLTSTKVCVRMPNIRTFITQGWFHSEVWQSRLKALIIFGVKNNQWFKGNKDQNKICKWFSREPTFIISISNGSSVYSWRASFKTTQ